MSVIHLDKSILQGAPTRKCDWRKKGVLNAKIVHDGGISGGV
jgi:hypothetical protein